MAIATILFFCFIAFMLLRMPSIQDALSLLCIIPGIASICASPMAPVAGAPQWADYPRLTSLQGQTFETLLEEVVDGPGLAMEIKRADFATRDLATLVSASGLSNRQRLAEALVDFVSNSRMVGQGLHRFSSKVGGAVDNIIAANDFALHSIEAVNSKRRADSLNIFWPFGSDEATATEVVMKTFANTMDTLSVNIERLLIEAMLNLSNLEKLEQQLTTIHEIVVCEDNALAASKDFLLAALWTKLGGHRREMRHFEHHLTLLAGVDGYYKQALKRVITALQILQGMANNMEELRARVAAPELVGTWIPVEVQMRSIRAGLDRLQDRRVQAQFNEVDIVARVLRGSSERTIDVL